MMYVLFLFYILGIWLESEMYDIVLIMTATSLLVSNELFTNAYQCYLYNYLIASANFYYVN